MLPEVSFRERKLLIFIITRKVLLSSQKQVKSGEKPRCVLQIRLVVLRYIRLSGAGETVVEENSIGNCAAALLAQDLFKYWYKSGRVRHLIYRNNRLYNCNGKAVSSFFTIAIDGLDPAAAPKIHDTVEFYGNTVTGLKNRFVKSVGLKNLLMHHNIFEDGREIKMQIDGEELIRK